MALSHLIGLWVSTLPLSKKKLEEPQRNVFASLDCRIDNLPIVILNDSDDSDRPSIAGSLLLNVAEDIIDVESLCGVLRVHVIQKKPFKKWCKDCKHQSTEIKRYQFIKVSTAIKRNIRSFPFSCRIPSYTPPSMDTSLVSVSYEFEAIASIRRNRHASDTPQLVTFNCVLPVTRSISIPNSLSRSNHIFQYTGIEVGCNFNPVMDLNGKNTLSLIITGLRSCPGNGDHLQFWRVCKGTWTLEESIETIAMPCALHTYQDGAAKDDRGQVRKKTSILGDVTFYEGWTTDDDLGTLSMSLSFGIKKGARYTQDTGDSSDISVAHTLAIELVLMKEQYSKGRPDQAVRTGVGRILRSNHRVILNEYARQLDLTTVESLPCYQDLRPGPPFYSEEHVATE